MTTSTNTPALYVPTVNDTRKAELVKRLRSQVADATYYLAQITQYATDLEDFKFGAIQDEYRHERVIAETANVFRKCQELQRSLSSSIDQDRFNILDAAATLIRS